MMSYVDFKNPIKKRFIYYLRNAHKQRLNFHFSGKCKNSYKLSRELEDRMLRILELVEEDHVKLIERDRYETFIHLTDDVIIQVWSRNRPYGDTSFVIIDKRIEQKQSTPPTEFYGSIPFRCRMREIVDLQPNVQKNGIYYFGGVPNLTTDYLDQVICDMLTEDLL